MKEYYHIDLNKYSLEIFKKSLAERNLIPSRKILKENLGKNFSILENEGIENLGGLIKTFNKKETISAFAGKTSMSERYLTVLVREAKSFTPNPVALNKLSGVNKKYLENLSDAGITNTKHLFNKAYKYVDREELSDSLKIPIAVVTELVHLSDLCRLYGVGPVFARLLYDIGVISVDLFIKYSADEIVAVYEKETGKKADFSRDDILFSQEIAQDLKIVIEV